MNTLIGLLIFIFILSQLWKLIKYGYGRLTQPGNDTKFPVWPAVIFGGLVLFYLLAFFVDNL